MKRIFSFFTFLFICSVCYAAPSTLLSITPSAVDAKVIDASDENSRNNSISTWANAHDHTDITQVGNTLKVGDATAGDKTIQANNADASLPYIRYDDTNDRWVVSRDGSEVTSLVVQTGTAASGFIMPSSPSINDALRYNGVVWINTGTLQDVSNLARTMTSASGNVSYTGIGFKPKALLVFAAISGSTSAACWGFTDGSQDHRLLFSDDASNTYGTNTSQLIQADTGVSTGQGATLSSFDADGFTLTWTKSGSPTGTLTVLFIAFY